MKLARILLTAVCLTLSFACSAAFPTGPDPDIPEHPIPTDDGGTAHGSGG